MKIIDIVKQTAELLAMPEEISVLNTATEENEAEVLFNSEIHSLFTLFKYSLQELCTNYIPIVNVVDVEIQNNYYPVSNLNNFIKIESVNKNGNPVNFKILNRSIYVKESGLHSIKYATYPNVNSLFEEIDYFSNLSPDVLVLGLAAYYSLSRGRFEEFEIFHENYLEKAESLKEIKNFCIPQRRWE